MEAKSERTISSLPTGEAVVKKHADLIADPAVTSNARQYFASHKDELTDKAIYWLGVFEKYSTDYEKKRAQLQLQHERDGMATTPAKDRAKAETVMDKEVVSSARFVHRFYSNLLKRLESAKWD